MIYLWAWGGKYIGYRDGDNLWSHDGKHIGHFHNDEVYANNGKYIGEIKNKNRLIVNLSKTSKVRGASTSFGNRSATSFADYVGYAMYAGYEDFTIPSK